jgi:hypothetical protein
MRWEIFPHPLEMKFTQSPTTDCHYSNTIAYAAGDLNWDSGKLHRWFSGPLSPGPVPSRRRQALRTSGQVGVNLPTHDCAKSKVDITRVSRNRIDLLVAEGGILHAAGVGLVRFHLFSSIHSSSMDQFLRILSPLIARTFSILPEL